jgi:hypothetical protein
MPNNASGLGSNTMTVQEFRTLIQQVPQGRNNALIIIPQSVEPFPVVINYAVDELGNEVYTIVGYMNWATKTYDVVV